MGKGGRTNSCQETSHSPSASGNSQGREEAAAGVCSRGSHVYADPQDLGKQATDGLASVYKLLSKHICIEVGQKSSFSIFYKMLWKKKLEQIFGQPRKCLINNSTNVLQIKCDPKPA